MRFSDWTAIDELRDVPEKPGLFQIKAGGELLAYPTGKSAMVYYGYAEQLAHGLDTFKSDMLPVLELDDKELMVRWMAAEDKEERFKRYLDTFLSNFGSLPVGNEIWLQKSQEGM